MSHGCFLYTGPRKGNGCGRQRAGEGGSVIEELLKIFPVHLRDGLRAALRELRGLEEIRIRVCQPIVFWAEWREFFLSERDGALTRDGSGAYRVTQQDISEMLVFISRYSMFAFEEEVRNGFITLEGGHRVGLSGQAVFGQGRIQALRNISYLNIRISHEKKGCAEPFVSYLYKEEDNRQSDIYNTLLVSAPGRGKTTLLRDFVRLLSDGSAGHMGLKVSVVDERSEIAGCHHGVPQNDIGLRTDVLDGCPKSQGMMLLIRTMSPQVLAVDELGMEDDVAAVMYAVHCGCSILGSVHAADLAELSEKAAFRPILEQEYFGRYLVIGQQGDGTRTYRIYNEKREQIC